VQPTKIKLDDRALLEELLPLVGEELWVQTLYDGVSSASSFVARLERVQPVNWSLRELLLTFDAAAASANLGCSRMTAWRMVDPLNETYWFDFTIGDRRVVQLHRIPSLRWRERSP
jgi:hypothetical protein